MPEVLKRVGRYDLLDVIGRGGAAVVYLAHQRDLRRNVALKELAPFHAADATFAERFVDESRLAGSLSHANVVVVHEYFEDAGVPYIAMEYLPHGSLRQYIGNLSTAQIAGVLEGVLAGLSAGEAHGIVHRDLKPENLLVGGDGRVKIADFGVARALNKAATRAVVTVAGTTIGTPTYMSPEQALGTTLTPATDLYSLGVVAWEMLAGTSRSRRPTRRSPCSTGTCTSPCRPC
jgi:serine/threonine protein kinase